MGKRFEITIKDDIAGQTLNDFFNRIGVGKERKRSLINKNLCFKNYELINGETILNEGDRLVIELGDYQYQNYRPIDFSLTILYEDDYLLIINKPHGYIVYDIDDKIISVSNFISGYYKNCGIEQPVIPVHRLDFDTSGCLMFAKDALSASYFSKAFENKEIVKQYYALVEGDTLAEGVIDRPIGSNRHINGKMVICKSGKSSITKYRLVANNNHQSLLEVEPLTGRTHQIRVHLASIGNPLVGDKLYGARKNYHRICLHCFKLTFFHPFKNKTITIKSAMPTEFKI